MFTCMECGGNVKLLAKSGRKRVFARGVVLPIPENFAVPTCDTCDEIYVNKELGKKLDAILRKRNILSESDWSVFFFIIGIGLIWKSRTKKRAKNVG